MAYLLGYSKFTVWSLGYWVLTKLALQALLLLTAWMPHCFYYFCLYWRSSFILVGTIIVCWKLIKEDNCLDLGWAGIRSVCVWLWLLMLHTGHHYLKNRTLPLWCYFWVDSGRREKTYPKTKKNFSNIRYVLDLEWILPFYSRMKPWGRSVHALNVIYGSACGGTQDKLILSNVGFFCGWNTTQIHDLCCRWYVFYVVGK